MGPTLGLLTRLPSTRGNARARGAMGGKGWDPIAAPAEPARTLGLQLPEIHSQEDLTFDSRIIPTSKHRFRAYGAVRFIGSTLPTGMEGDGEQESPMVPPLLVTHRAHMHRDGGSSSFSELLLLPMGSPGAACLDSGPHPHAAHDKSTMVLRMAGATTIPSESCGPPVSPGVCSTWGVGRACKAKSGCVWRESPQQWFAMPVSHVSRLRSASAAPDSSHPAAVACVLTCRPPGKAALLSPSGLNFPTCTRLLQWLWLAATHCSGFLDWGAGWGLRASVTHFCEVPAGASKMLGLPLNVDPVAQGTSPVLLLTSTQPPRNPSLVPCVARSFSLDWLEARLAAAAPLPPSGHTAWRLLRLPTAARLVHETACLSLSVTCSDVLGRTLPLLPLVKVALMTLTLFPVRLLVAAAMMLLAWPLALVASLGSAEKEPEQPLALWRKVVDFLLKAIMRTMWFAGGFHRVAVKGRQALPTEAAILTLAPHSSYFDAIPVTMTMSSIVMKAESRDIPIWGTLIRYIRPVFVSRSDQDSRRKTVEEIKRRAQSNGKWPQVTHAALIVFQWFYSERCELREWGGRNRGPSSGAGFRISSPNLFSGVGSEPRGKASTSLGLAPAALPLGPYRVSGLLWELGRGSVQSLAYVCRRGFRACGHPPPAQMHVLSPSTLLVQQADEPEMQRVEAAPSDQESTCPLHTGPMPGHGLWATLMKAESGLCFQGSRQKTAGNGSSCEFRMSPSGTEFRLPRVTCSESRRPSALEQDRLTGCLETPPGRSWAHTLHMPTPHLPASSELSEQNADRHHHVDVARTWSMLSCVGFRGHTTVPFSAGAFIPGAPVQPVVLRYPNKLVSCVFLGQGPRQLEILWLTLCQFHNQVEIEVLPALGVSVTDYTFEDCQLALAEGQLRLPADTCLLEFARLVRGLGLKPEKLEKDLDKYSESARKKGGEKMGIAEFAASLEVPVSDLLEDMFSLFDESGSGQVDLRECVVALSVVCRPARTLDTIQLAFKMYGAQEDGSVGEGDLSCILKTALGVAELTVTDLFRAIDQEEKGKITFADFHRFAEMYPDFAEEYLYPDQTHFESCAETPPALIPNGFCADFSPENSDAGRKPVRKKLD
ncbi:PREDICTED: lysophosphatidylcholine acyltransferase 1 [Mandrillus leucophaeus]|nr:PREDICTED: lysophosphatidylcholine acyltransferase 1 [Mandrillus leucophaeus]